MVAGEHVPDRLGEPAGDVDLRDFRAALFAETSLVGLVAIAVRLPRSPWNFGDDGPGVIVTQ